jgi:hypothetical protein
MASVPAVEGLIVAVGSTPSIVTSTNGVTWTTALAEAGSQLQGIASCGQLAIAVGSGVIYKSTNGTAWTASTSSLFAGLEGIACGSGRWVAVGSMGTVVTSTDAQTWTLVHTMPAYSCRWVAYGAGRWVAVCQGPGPGTLITSTDGVNWIQPAGSFSQLLDTVAYHDGRWVAAGSFAAMATSTNGLDWSFATIPTSPPGQTIFGIKGNGSLWVAVGSSGTILTSPDGLVWTQRLGGTMVTLRDAIHTPTGWIVVGDGAVYSSTTGAVWTQVAAIVGRLAVVDVAVPPAILPVQGVLSVPPSLPYPVLPRPPLLSSNVAPVARAEIDVDCAGDLILNAMDSSDIDGLVVAASWRFEDGAEISGLLARRDSVAPGAYGVRLRVVDDAGAFADLTTRLIVKSC